MSWLPVEEASDLTRCSTGDMLQTILGDVVQGICRRMASEQDRLYYIPGKEWGEAPSDNAERASAQTIPRDVVQGICRRMASEQDRLYYISDERIRCRMAQCSC